MHMIRPEQPNNGISSVSTVKQEIARFDGYTWEDSTDTRIKQGKEATPGEGEPTSVKAEWTLIPDEFSYELKFVHTS